MRLDMRGQGHLGGPNLWRPGGDGRRFVDNLLENFTKRFPFCFKTLAPYNALCLLDPNNSDIYFDNEDQIQEAIDVIKNDQVYNKLRGEMSEHVEPVEDENRNQNEVVTDRRAELLARKRSVVEDRVRREEHAPGTDVVGSMIDEEMAR